MNSNYTNNRYSVVPRGWIVFAQIAGSILALISIGVMLYMVPKLSNQLNPGDYNNKAIIALVFAILLYFGWKTFYTAFIIIKFLNNNDDNTIISNRFIISGLSLTMGGFFTPFAMSMMPNVASDSTMNPRWYLTKFLSMTALIGSLLLTGGYLSIVMTGNNSLNWNQIFDNSNQYGQITLGIVITSVIMFVWSLITVVLFYQKNAEEKFLNKDSSIAKIMNFIAITFLIVATVELMLVIIMSIFRLLGAIADLFSAASENNGGFAFFRILFSLFNLFITFIYTTYIMAMTWQSIVGIWSKDEVVKYQKYDRLDSALAKQNS